MVWAELLAAVQLAPPLSWLMARVGDSEVQNCPYVNHPINAEQSHITSALISPFACEDMSRIWEILLQGMGMLYS